MGAHSRRQTLTSMLIAFFFVGFGFCTQDCFKNPFPFPFSSPNGQILINQMDVYIPTYQIGAVGYGA